MRWNIQSKTWDALLDEFDEDLFDDAGTDLRGAETALQDQLGSEWLVSVMVTIRPFGDSAKRSSDGE